MKFRDKTIKPVEFLGDKQENSLTIYIPSKFNHNTVDETIAYLGQNEESAAGASRAVVMVVQIKIASRRSDPETS